MTFGEKEQENGNPPVRMTVIEVWTRLKDRSRAVSIKIQMDYSEDTKIPRRLPSILGLFGMKFALDI